MKTKFKLFQKNLLFILLVDLLLICLSLYWAYLVRFEFRLSTFWIHSFQRLLLLSVFVKIASFYYFDLYKGMWRYTSIADLANVIKASSVSTAILICYVLLQHRFQGFSRAVFVIDWCFTIMLVSGFRLSVRFYFEYTEGKNPLNELSRTFLRLFKERRDDRKKLLIIGAGDCGEKIIREIRDNVELKYHVMGFLDDNPVKKGKKIHGIPVLGTIEDIVSVAKRFPIDETLIAIPSATSAQMREIVDHCKLSGIPFKTVPSYGELINGKVSLKAVREVAYRDLLGREVIHLDEEKIGSYLQGQTVLVTGAGGSIGSELCRQICRFAPQKVVLLERAESPLYEIELELKENFPGVEMVPTLTDVQDRCQLEKVFDRWCPQTVFHAAAYKHVPMLEHQPWRAIENNVLGTENVVAAAERAGAERFVFISTDKAVRPTNVMGASKRIAEMVVQNQNGCGHARTRFMIVRFGNVVNSVGSVVPLFRKQIAKGGPVTVTHPDVTRYFMTIPEACQLILQAGAMGTGGEIFLLDMGTPIKIDDMARDLIRLSGFEPEIDIPIRYIGLRPGEKLYEELITEGEGIVATDHKKIMVLRGTDCNLDVLQRQIDGLLAISRDQDSGKLKSQLKEIITEYRPA